MSAIAVTVEGLSKRYRLYHERNQSLKATVMRGGRARYEEFWALRDVSFEIEAGQTFGLIGENGSGKSTLLKCMARILTPDEGRITVDGKLSALLELGAGFHPELTGRENIYLNGAILGLSKRQIRARFDDIIDFAGLEHFVDAPVKNYSSGMYIRLGFSVAINVDPDVLLVDEILAVGDAEFQRKCAEKFDDLRSRGKTIVIVSHALESLRNLCDRAALLEHGRLRAVGSTAHVIAEYIEGIHSDRAQDASGTRWGSGEAQIARVELIDRTGKPVRCVRTGDAVTLRLHYVVNETVEQPVFGLGLHRIDGVHITGPNTRDADVVPAKIDGPGYVDFRIDRLLLLPGTYDVSASIFNFTVTHNYDARVRALRFDVTHGVPHEQLGVVSLGGSWDLAGVEGGA
jgi:ABC-2 type transport system ATP-binding protein